MRTNTQLAIIQVDEEAQSTQLALVSTFNLPESVSRKLLAKHGVETMAAAIEVKKDGLDVSIHYFLKMVDMGLNPQEVAIIYQTRGELLNRLKENREKAGFSLIQLGRLAKAFSDFRESEFDDQTEMAWEIQQLFKYETFKNAVKKVIDFAQQLGLNTLAEVFDINEEYSSGDVFQYYFQDHEYEDYGDE